MEIDTLSTKLDRAQWTIQYLEQRNKQLEDQHMIVELQNIRENRQATQHREIEFTSLEQQVMRIERLLSRGSTYTWRND